MIQKFEKHDSEVIYISKNPNLQSKYIANFVLFRFDEIRKNISEIYYEHFD